MTAIPVILAGALALGIQAPPQSQQDTAVILTGCVVPAPEIEDTFQLVPAEPEPGRPVGTAGTSPAWTVPLYLLVGGSITAEHLNKTVEVTGTIQPPGAPVVVDPKKTGDTTMRTGQAAAPAARLQVRTAKVVAATCTPRKSDRQAK
ncbi:MAG TPA: hypothetical protein VFZ36_10295 [Vicinamibacterales bacterium]